MGEYGLSTQTRQTAKNAGKTEPKVPYSPVDPKHYRDLGEYSALHVTEQWDLGYHLGQVLKYIQRRKLKSGTSELEELKKARWYLQRYLYLLDPENEDDPAADRD